MPFFYFAKKTFASTGIPSRHVKRRRKPPPVLHRRALTVPSIKRGKKKARATSPLIMFSLYIFLVCDALSLSFTHFSFLFLEFFFARFLTASSIHQQCYICKKVFFFFFFLLMTEGILFNDLRFVRMAFLFCSLVSFDRPRLCWILSTPHLVAGRLH